MKILLKLIAYLTPWLEPILPKGTILFHWCDKYIYYGMQVPPLVGAVTLAEVTTNSATDILPYSFTGNGSFTRANPNTSNITERGFAYFQGTAGDATTANDTVFETGNWEATAGNTLFSLPITGLQSGTPYRVAAYAINSAGTAYGDTITVTTDEVPLNYGQGEVTGQGSLDGFGITPFSVGEITAEGSIEGKGLKNSLAIGNIDAISTFFPWGLNKVAYSNELVVPFQVEVQPGGAGVISGSGEIFGLGQSPVLGEGLGTITGTGSITGLGQSVTVGTGLGIITGQGVIEGSGLSVVLPIPYIKKGVITPTKVEVEIVLYHEDAIKHDMYRSEDPDPEVLGDLVGENIDPTQIFEDTTVDPDETYYYTLRTLR